MFDYQKAFVYIFALCVLLLVCHTAIKYQYGFWYYQPVQHTWRYIRPWRWSSTPAVIRPELPNIATTAPGALILNPKIINTLYADLLSDTQWATFLHLISTNYLMREDGNMYIPTIQNIMPFFVGHNDPCFISFYYNAIHRDTGTGLITTTQETIGTITSRPLLATFSAATMAVPLYYVDFLCVHKDWRKQGIASKLIQTHEYYQRHKTRDREIHASLFKHETDILKGIVPLVAYTTYGYTFDVSKTPKDSLLPPYKMSTVTKANMPGFMDFMRKIQDQPNARPPFDVFITPAIANVLELITTNNLYIHTVVHMDTKQIIAAYFYKNTCTSWDKGAQAQVLMLTASICSEDCSQSVFIRGFMYSCRAIFNKHCQYGVLGIEDISHNSHLITNIRARSAPLIQSPTAYFLYNYFHHTISSDRAFILT